MPLYIVLPELDCKLGKRLQGNEFNPQVIVCGV